ncbi:hypothetical protein R4B61_00435 [Fructilactobacillus vespulae]|uniref:hypothetical protein n=1 Tax=Fructilactobacillus vespulae TaxID=1249630 RepID=UPI0039B6E3C8
MSNKPKKRKCPRCKGIVVDGNFCSICCYQFFGEGKSYHNNHLRELQRGKRKMSDKFIVGKVFPKSSVASRASDKSKGILIDGTYFVISNPNEIGNYNKIKEANKLIHEIMIDRDGAENYLDIDEIGYWGMENKVCNSTKFIMDEIENNPQLAPLKQFAVEV